MAQLFKVNGFLYFPKDAPYDASVMTSFLLDYSKQCKWAYTAVEDNEEYENPNADLQIFDNNFQQTPYFEDYNPDFGEVIVGGTYRHFKGHEVLVLAIAQESENLGRFNVIYEHLGSGRVWSRPYGMFCSLVDKEKYPDVKQKFRFELIKETRYEQESY